MVNRQLRRAEEKKERKAEREKERAKAERVARREARRGERRATKANPTAKAADTDGAKQQRAVRQSNPGRFSGALMAATIFFIALQTVAPSDGTLMSQFVSASFYLLFGYFAVLWMSRRNAPRAVPVAIAGGALMAAATLLSQLLQESLPILPFMLAAAVPLTVAGAYLGRLVWNRAP